MKAYNVKENIDTLHTVVGEAVERKAKGQSGTDVWKEGLEPQAAIRARTVPLLETEVKRLRTVLKDVRCTHLSYTSINQSKNQLLEA